MTRVTVVIPTLNAERTISRCLDSISSQSGVELETIVVDAHSGDSTARLCEGRARFVQVPCSMTRARLIGTELANSEFVFNVDSDQVLRQGCVERAAGLDKPAVAFGEVATGSGIVSLVNRLEKRAIQLNWSENLDPVSIHSPQILQERHFIAGVEFHTESSGGCSACSILGGQPDINPLGFENRGLGIRSRCDRTRGGARSRPLRPEVVQIRYLCGRLPGNCVFEFGILSRGALGFPLCTCC